MSSPHLLISEAADLLGLTPKALRHYEKIGLVVPIRSENGYRVYTADHMLRLLRIRRLRSLGLSLTQIKLVLDEENEPQGWQTILHALLDQVDAQIDVLEQRRDELERLIADGSADILAVPDELPVSFQRALEYLDRHLTGPQASLWPHEKQLFQLADPRAALEGHLAMLSQWLIAPPVGVYERRFAPGHHTPVRAEIMAGLSMLAGEEDPR